MTRTTRRRFLAISAAAAGMAALPARAAAVYQWRGIALGAQATITLAHPQAQALTARAAAEIARLEGVFSLYRTDSALARLNATGVLEAPPFELLECLGLCGQVHHATGGLFDPTVQPLWSLYAERHAAGGAPTRADIAATLPLVGWHGVAVDSTAIRLQPGMALTLNGIAQGYIADRVAALLRAEGLTDVLVNTGEMRAIGGRPGGGDWPVRIEGGGDFPLHEDALATSAPRGTVFDAAGTVGHILDPRDGLPAPAQWRSVSIAAPLAAVADALSTAACLMPDRAAVEASLAAFTGARIAAIA
ncbi:FAD:protein FMN transferase [Ruixingdingia sedimenti]|uniref:FAD:protein FMN transferase n=1 Tax=Ruixingdingia sedimenti TaxID=3073604 RepID=A0ABU1FB58_9RHOB|nr:FAD:protein FMN transferase [Xinfangfangia sp. LG-4]MDR5653642.1 FAD:protein FMN transferase [Xinfangfangia sp. LG-4]